ncbi:hypothetical protein GXW77_18510, partial [Roseomonas alkaliterrae]|uniref:hypothetical protein n=1 Tax=Neoroseomonas alkaliterrae TaxID=1452450 RepID=UPI001BAE0ADC
MGSLFSIRPFLRAAHAALQILPLAVAAPLAVDQRRADGGEHRAGGGEPAAQRRDHAALVRRASTMATATAAAPSTSATPSQGGR